MLQSNYYVTDMILIDMFVCVPFTAQEMAARGERVVSKTYESLEAQVWSMLKGFSTRPTDLAKVRTCTLLVWAGFMFFHILSGKW